SERVERRSRLALTCPASWIAPPNNRSFSVSVVLPASGWEMIAKVRRRSTSVAMGDGVSAPNNVGKRIFIGRSTWQFWGLFSRPRRLRSTGEFFTHNRKLEPLLLCSSDVLLELCKGGGGPF